MSGYEEQMEQMREAKRISDALYNRTGLRSRHEHLDEGDLLDAYMSGMAMACALILESPEDVLIHIGFMLADARDALNKEEN